MAESDFVKDQSIEGSHTQRKGWPFVDQHMSDQCLSKEIDPQLNYIESYYDLFNLALDDGQSISLSER